MLQYKGLSDQEVEQSRLNHGSNKLTEQATETFWQKFADNLKDPMVIILLVALVIVIFLSFTGYTEWYEGVGIAVAVGLATFVSTFSEFKNEQTFQKLQAEASRIYLNVFRNGQLSLIRIDDIVVGDFIFLQPGDKIPVDGLIVYGNIKVNQAMLNGEPEPVTKKSTTNAEMGLDKPSAVYRGTIVEDGEGVLEAKIVGDHTLFGKLAQSLKAEERIGPLRLKLSQLANSIAKFGYVGAPLIAIAFMANQIFIENTQGFDVYFADWSLVLADVLRALILSVIIIVVVVPEGLPMMIAIVLAQNMRKLLKSKVLVRQLLGIETAGSLNILFSDKTGTITKGQLDAVGFLTINQQAQNGFNKYQTLHEIPSVLQTMVLESCQENTSCVVNPHAEKVEERILGGNSTDRALLQFVNAHTTPYESNYKIEQQVLFNSTRKFSSVWVTKNDNTSFGFVKGAAERIIVSCSHFYNEKGEKEILTTEKINELNAVMDKMADDGFRIIGLATSGIETGEENLPNELTLIGFSLIRDELREDSKAAIEELTKAGIQVVMLTGDRHGTAVSISKDAGLVTSDKDITLRSEELNELSDDQVRELIPRLRVVSRCLPQDKTRLVKLAQSLGMVVGMTGDGVNDSPALSNADVGFGLGSGTEVAKEASDIVVLDDKLSSIARAVHYGRTIYRSVQKFITFQLTVNVSAILLSFIGPFLGFELPLTMIQLLWINLIMDSLAALAFSGEPPLPKYMEESPKSREESIINKEMWSSILVNGLYATIVCIIFLKTDFVKDLFAREGGEMFLESFKITLNELVFLTAFFAVFVFIHNFNKFNVRVDDTKLLHHLNENKGFLQVIGLIFLVQVFITYFGKEIFRTVGLTMEEWLWVLLFSVLIIPFDIVRKLIVKSK